MSPVVALVRHSKTAGGFPLSVESGLAADIDAMTEFDRCCRKISFYGRFGFKFAAAVGRSLMH
jgi:hypothetical protein